jgi:hypothetical protein
MLLCSLQTGNMTASSRFVRKRLFSLAVYHKALLAGFTSNEPQKHTVRSQLDQDHHARPRPAEADRQTKRRPSCASVQLFGSRHAQIDSDQVERIHHSAARRK